MRAFACKKRERLYARFKMKWLPAHGVNVGRRPLLVADPQRQA
jgi:hypothetical protein